MDKSFFAIIATWLIPGLGHFLLNRRQQGILLLIGTILLIGFGLALGGQYYPGNPSDFGIMYWLHQIAAAGNATFLLGNFLFKESFQSGAAQEAFRSTYFEYGGRCLALAGLLNYLAMLDVLDLTLKRKS